MEIEITNDSKIEYGLSRKKRSTLIIDDIKLKKDDIIIYKCQKCGNQIKQQFAFKEKFIQKKFICQQCECKQTKLIERNGYKIWY